MSTSGGAGDGAERMHKAGVRLHVSPVAQADVERLGATFERLPSVTTVRLDSFDGTTATYAVTAPSVARLLTDLGQVADTVGAALTRTIAGEVVLALPADSAAPSDQAAPPPQPPAPKPPAANQLDGGARAMHLTAPTGGATKTRVSDAPQREPQGPSRRSLDDARRRRRLRALPNPGEPRSTPLTRLQERLVVLRGRLARAGRRRRGWQAPAAVVLLAALLAVALTVSDRCSSDSNRLPPRPESKDTVMAPRTQPLQTAAIAR
jgi:hypothetical protein